MSRCYWRNSRTARSFSKCIAIRIERKAMHRCNLSIGWPAAMISANVSIGVSHRGNVSRRGGSSRDRYEGPLIIARYRAREKFNRY
jgi:hypothetical protein